MIEKSDGESWVRLSRLSSRFDANVAALRGRDEALADQIVSHSPKATYVISPVGEVLRLGTVQADAPPVILPNPVPAAAARGILQKLASMPGDNGPVLVAGLDQGWLWDALAKTKVNVPAAPGHRPPVYFLVRDIERLWVVLHLHDWRELLTDQRCILLAGEDVSARLERHLIAHPYIAWPKVNVTIDPSVWGGEGNGFDDILARAQRVVDARCKGLVEQIRATYAGRTPADIAQALGSRPLRVLGITSLYTTFLQHSMRDWLAGMEQLGHTTQLLIEQHDHERPHQARYLGAIAEFQPDLLLLIDHYRAEFPQLPAEAMPCVMWVQDRLPSIFSAIAGARQTRLDYCIGFGRLELSRKHGYAAERFLPAQVGVNPAHFARPTGGSVEHEMARYGCDVSYVGHASMPAERILLEAIEQQSIPTGRKLFEDVFDWMRGIYASGSTISHASLIRAQIAQSAERLRISIPPMQVEAVYDFFNNRVNNALFRHQALQWLAELADGDATLRINLWGSGWQDHPTLGRFARGPADNRLQLPAIYRSSTINLQVTPHGAVHQRLFEGLAAGGFFLVRQCAGDLVEPIYQRLWNWCTANDIATDREFHERADEQTAAMMRELRNILGVDPLSLAPDFTEVLRLSADGEYIRSAASVWPEHYPQVCFNSRDSLHAQVREYLADADARAAIANGMRDVVLRRFSYAGMSQRLLQFIAHDLQQNSVQAVAA